MENKIKDIYHHHFCNLKKIYYKNSFIIQDAKSIYYYLIGGKYRKELLKLCVIPTTFCNANCCFCVNKYLTDKREIMTFDLFKKAVDEWKDIGGKDIDLTPTIGDIFIDDKIFDKLDYICSKGMSCHFSTNGLLLDKNMDKILNSKLKTISISIGDIIPKYDSQIYGISKEVSEKRIQAITEFIRRNKNIEISLAFRPMRKFNHILKDMKKTLLWDYYCRGLFKMGYLTAYDNWGGMISKKDMLGVQVMKRSPKIKKYPCVRLSTFSILPNGDVRICGCRITTTFHDELVVGNLKNNTLKEIFNSSKYDKIIKEVLDGGIPDICKKCSFYQPKI